MRILVTGGCGFLGSNIVAEALRQDHDVTVADNLSRSGSAENLEWLRAKQLLNFHRVDVRSIESVTSLIRASRPDVVIHLAGQVAMTTSLENPRLDFETNVVGTHNVLEAIRLNAPDAAFIYSSTNKVYGDLEELRYEESASRYIATDFPLGFDEQLPLKFCSPYGCSKGAADQYALDYARMFGLRTVVLRHSSIFGDRQFSTFDQGWIGWFMGQAREAASDPQRPPFTVSGTGKQVRDVLFASDIVACYFSILKAMHRCQGQAFNIGGGPGNSLSLLELLKTLEAWTESELRYRHVPWRQSDQKVFIADNSKIERASGWRPAVSKEVGLARMYDWICSR